MKKALATIFVLLIATTALAQRPITFEDLAAFQRIGAPQLSPDGKWIAYDVSTTNLAANSRSSAIHLIAADGSGAARLLTEPGTAGDSPSWSPDGKSIAFASSRDGSRQIYLLDVATGKATKATSLPAGVGSFKWLPNGSGFLVATDVWVACGADFACHEAKEKEAKEAPTKARIIDSLLYRHWTSWQAPTRTHILHVPLAGAPRDLTPGPQDAPPFSIGGGDEFDVSPDGKEMVFARNTDPRPERSTNSDLFLVSLSSPTIEPRRITTRTGADTSPVYSPDGRWIAWRSQSRNGYESDLWELWLYDRANGQTRRLAADFQNWVESIDWSPDSKSIFFVAPLEGEEQIYEIRLDGRIVPIPVEGSASSIEISPDRKSIYYSLSKLHRPADIYALRLGARPVQLTHHNDALLGQLSLPPAEKIWWTGAENARVQGWLLKPPGFDPSKKYPAIVLVHGGPQGAWGNAWSYRWNPQMYTARGYVVLMPNPRGSSGFGQKFVEEISRDWAGKVWIDLMNGVDQLAAQPYVDATRMGAAGASYGGYMVNWIAGHTNRFKALVSHAGVYNLESMWGVTEEIWFPEWEFGGAPWETPEQYTKWSPHRAADKFATPMLVTHGELDFRVPVGEAMQLFTALQRRDVPSRMVLFPDEGHWILKPQNSKLWHEQVLGWFDRWLAPAAAPR